MVDKLDVLDCQFESLKGSSYLLPTIHSVAKKLVEKTIESSNPALETIGEMAHIYSMAISNATSDALNTLTSLCLNGNAEICKWKIQIANSIVNGMNTTSFDTLTNYTYSAKFFNTPQMPSMTTIFQAMSAQCSGGTVYACNFLERMKDCFVASQSHRDWPTFAGCHANATFLRAVERLGGNALDRAYGL